MFDEDIDCFLEDHGVPCVAGSSAFMGILDAPGEVISGGIQDVVSTGYALTVATAILAAAQIRYGTTIKVNGASYMAKDTLLLDDGVFSSVHLSKV